MTTGKSKFGKGNADIAQTETFDPYAPVPYDPKIKKIIIIMVDFCSDSRNTNKAYYDIKRKIIADLRKKGIHVVFRRMNNAGVFVTPGSIEETKSFLLNMMHKKYAAYEGKAEFELQYANVGHGHARRKREYAHTETYHANQLVMTKHDVDCGMAHAEDAARFLNEFILEKPRTFTVNGREMTIANQADLNQYYKITYGKHAPKGWDGDILKIVKNIGDLAAHPKKQMEIFDESIRKDPRFSGMRLGKEILTFAYILNYAKSKIYRVDGKIGQEDIILKPIFDGIREEKKTNGLHDQEMRVSKQNSPFLAITDSHISGGRQIFTQKIMGADSPAGRIFSVAREMGEGAFDLISALAIFYAMSPKCLNKKENGRMGVAAVGEKGVERIHKKINEDNIVRLTVDTYAKERHALVLNDKGSVVDHRQHFPHKNPNAIKGRKLPRSH